MIRPVFLLSFFLMGVVLAQDEAVEDESTTEAVSESTDDAEDDVVLDGSEDHSADDEDIFVPTDEVSYQQSVLGQAGVTELRLSYRDYGVDPRVDLGFRIARNVD